MDLVPITETALTMPYTGTSLETVTKEISWLLGKLEDNSKLTLKLIFETGKRLAAAKEMLDHGQFLPWLQQNFTLSERTAQRYIKVYETYKDMPLELIETKTIKDAYIEAGIKKLLPVEATESATTPDLPRPVSEKDQLVWLFRQPTRSGASLKKHRVQAVNGQVYIYRKDTGMAAPALDLYLPKPAGLPEQAWQKALDTYVIATELYLETIEDFEARGIIAGEAV
jgi:hypothetical protein|uniref:DUF3102 domain-containing protein n=1 Tax=Gracilinema caldarium TaxID=215591 RepID=A0A7C3EEJ8_9SPIR